MSDKAATLGLVETEYQKLRQAIVPCSLFLGGGRGWQ